MRDRKIDVERCEEFCNDLGCYLRPEHFEFQDRNPMKDARKVYNCSGRYSACSKERGFSYSFILDSEQSQSSDQLKKYYSEIYVSESLPSRI